MKKLLLVLHLCALFLTGCKKEPPLLSPKNTLESFQITTPNALKTESTVINFSIGDSTVVGITGNLNSRAGLIAQFTSSGTTVKVNGIIQESGVTVNDFTKPVVYTVIAENGTEKKYTVTLKAFTGLPIITIFTEGPIDSKEIYTKGTMSVDGNGSFQGGQYEGAIQIRGRGNSSWQMDKKSYKIKLPSKVAMLELPADKEWALIANYIDRSLLRNDVGFQLSEEFGAAWTPRRKFVEVFLNGQYNGNYLLVETIKQADQRVNINTKEGGWLAEINHNLPDGDPRFCIAACELNIIADLKESQLDFSVVKAQLDTLYYQLNRQEYDLKDGYHSKFDLDAYVTWYMANELMMNHDGAFFSSVFIQKNNAASKIQMGPVWDFDLSSGNVSTGHVSPEGWYIIYSEFANRLYEDSTFKKALKVKWNANKSKILGISKYIDMKAKELTPSAHQNFLRWKIMDIVLPNSVAMPGTYQGEVDYFKDWLAKRTAWMDKEINK